MNLESLFTGKITVILNGIKPQNILLLREITWYVMSYMLVVCYSWWVGIGKTWRSRIRLCIVKTILVKGQSQICHTSWKKSKIPKQIRVCSHLNRHQPIFSSLSIIAIIVGIVPYHCTVQLWWRIEIMIDTDKSGNIRLSMEILGSMRILHTVLQMWPLYKGGRYIQG